MAIPPPLWASEDVNLITTSPTSLVTVVAVSCEILRCGSEFLLAGRLSPHTPLSMSALYYPFRFLTVFLMMYRVKGAILIGIFLTSIISWPRGTPFTTFPHTDEGNAAFAFFEKVVAFHPIKRIGNLIDYDYKNGKVWYALVTLLYVDILGTTGTLYSMAKFAGLRDPVTMDFEGSTVAYCIDAFSISMGALMGTSPVTAFIESATGISGTWSILLHLVSRYQLLKERCHGICRGWQDWHHGDDDRSCLPCLGLFRPRLCQHTSLGYRWRPCNCWRTHDSQRARDQLGLRRRCHPSISHHHHHTPHVQVCVLSLSGIIVERR